MKKIIIWLAKTFDVSIEKEVTKVVTKEVIKYKYLTEGTVEGDVHVKGNLTVSGSLKVDGGVTFHRKEA